MSDEIRAKMTSQVSRNEGVDRTGLKPLAPRSLADTPVNVESGGYTRLLESLMPIETGDPQTRASDVDNVRKELEEYKKRLALKEEELIMHRIAKLAIENVDNTDSDQSDASRSASGMTPLLPIGHRIRQSPPNMSSNLGFGQNIWSTSNNRSVSGSVTPNDNLAHWNSARSIFTSTQDPLSQSGAAATSSTEPPTPLTTTTFSQSIPSHLRSFTRPSLSSGATALSSANLSSSTPNFLGLSQNLHPRGAMSSSNPDIFNPPVSYSGKPLPASLSRVSMLPSENSAPLALPQRKILGPSIMTRLSPTAAEFSLDPQQWRTPTGPAQNSSISQANPLSNGTVREPGFGSDWTQLVDKIIHGNDQQASILMQQKIKTVDRHEKIRMCDAIVQNCDSLMTNRFGNFLVQRVLEHGSPEQIHYIAAAISGHVVQLSMDAFGCHVIQKAFDTVTEEFKAQMVAELLCAIPETVKHRYACHVWQKLFELRWTSEAPQIMSYVNESLAGQWWDVAMGETGSLVVQNIFENCNSEDKRPCIEEVLAKIDDISKGQYGNWCIQHICEHGSEVDRTRAINYILNYAAEYSMDQFASKVVEKCLKIGGGDFLEQYLSRVCSSQGGRPRVPLVDIACNQYGNYLIQWILQYAESDEHKNTVRVHARKHIVSLRGSKYGSRVASLVTNMATHTRPGPPVGLQTTRGFTHYPSRGSQSNSYR